MSFKLFTDSAASLPGALLDELDIGLVSMTYTTPDGAEHICQQRGVDFDAEAFYSDIRTNHTHVRTTLINSAQFYEAFEPYCRDGVSLLYIGLSSGISGTYAAACAAADELREEYPGAEILTVDTLGASLGEGLLVLEAADLRDGGVSASEAAQRIDSLKKYVCQRFIVDDLVALRRGGRLSGTAAVVGTLMNIKPVLMGNEEGKIVCASRERGRARAIRALVDSFVELAVNPEKQTVGISHTGCYDDAVALSEQIRARCDVGEFLIVDHEPGTGSHLGPDALALFFYAADARTAPADLHSRAAAFASSATRSARDAVDTLRAAVRGGVKGSAEAVRNARAAHRASTASNAGTSSKNPDNTDNTSAGGEVE